MFKFNFGNKKPNIKQYVIIGIVLAIIVASVSRCTTINEKVLWDELDEIQKRYFPKSPVNDFILSEPEKLQRRIEKDVSCAVKNATPEYDRIIQKESQKYLPRYIEEKNNDEMCYTEACRSLGGPIRMCSPWYSGCLSGTESLTNRGI